MTSEWNDERLDRLAELVDKNTRNIDKLTEDIDQFRKESEELRKESKEQGLKFTYYQQATQWVVQLSFSLILAATITTIISAVVKR